MSIGLTSEEGQDLDFSRMMRRADAALYRAKRGGRNQVALRPFPNPALIIGRQLRKSRRSFRLLAAPSSGG